MDPIILASGSPRRQEFFRLLGLPFTSIPALIDETPPQGLSPWQAAEAIARQKVMALVEKRVPEQINDTLWIFGADTIIVLGNEIFGKAADRDAARVMLGRLAGRRHEVITAMALYHGGTRAIDCRSVSCEVTVAPLSAAEIEWYLDTGNWEGAAGSYRLQGMGACLITSIHGSPSAVEGLPLHDFYGMLRENGYPFGA